MREYGVYRRPAKHRTWDSRRHAPVAAYFKNPRRSMHVLSSAIGTLRDHCNFRSRTEFPSWHPGWQIFYTLPPPLSAGVFNSFIPGTRSITMGEILRLVARHSRRERIFA